MVQNFPDSVLEITLSFTRKTAENEWEDFHHSFTSNESLDPILDKLEMFLNQMGFPMDGRQLVVEKKVKEGVATDAILSYNGDNVKPFPTPFNQE